MAKLELKDGDTVVFLGDSITHQCLYTQYVEDYFYTRFPNVHIRFHNAGVGGDRAADALARFDQDVAEMPAAERDRNLRMNEYQAVGRPLVVEESYLTVYRELESVRGAVVADGNIRRRRNIVHGFLEWTKEQIMTYLASCPKPLRQFHYQSSRGWTTYFRL
jgi:hypothetical protein